MENLYVLSCAPVNPHFSDFDDDPLFLTDPTYGHDHEIILDFNDPFERLIAKIIRTPPFWRMIHIKQLGFCDTDYPGAHHTRFAHSVGAFDLMRQAIVSMKMNEGMTRDKAWRFTLEEKAAMLAALLHDIGHAAPGHSFESAGKAVFGKDFKSHEERGRELIEKTEIKQLIKKYHPKLYAMTMKILSEDDMNNNLWQQLLAGHLNVDTMDYEIRDAYFTSGGDPRPFIPFNVKQIIRYLRRVEVDGKPRLAVQHYAAPDVVQMLMGRVRMYQNVYWHRNTHARDLVFEQIAKELHRTAGDVKLKAYFKENPNAYVNVFAAGDQSMETHLRLTGPEVVSLDRILSDCPNAKLKQLARKMRSFSFSAPDPVDDVLYVENNRLTKEQEDLRKRMITHLGGLVTDKTVRMYTYDHPKRPEIYVIEPDLKTVVPLSEFDPMVKLSYDLRVCRGFFTDSRQRETFLDMSGNIVDIRRFEKDRQGRG